MTTLFFIGAAIVIYTYVGYPTVVWMLSRWSKPIAVTTSEPPAVSIIVAVRNEESAIARRVQEFTALMRDSALHGEILIVSDGSTDKTAGNARASAGDGIRLIELPRRGKAAALNAAVAAARHPILVFADARQTWAPDAVRRLLENFSEARVGGVTGDVILESRDGAMGGVGAYWRYETWLRRMEGRVHSSVGVCGPIAAVRRDLFRPIPQGTVLDDVYWPMRVVMQGFRVVYDARARAFDRLPERPRDEFRRKVRTLSGNFQLCARLPSLLVPWRNPIWFQFVSHKLLRLAVPWALLAMLVISAASPSPILRLALVVQVAFYAAALIPLRHGPRCIRMITSAAGGFVLLNAAAWVAFWVWLFGRTERSWTKVSFDAPAVSNATA